MVTNFKAEIIKVNLYQLYEESPWKHDKWEGKKNEIKQLELFIFSFIRVFQRDLILSKVFECFISEWVGEASNS